MKLGFAGAAGLTILGRNAFGAGFGSFPRSHRELMLPDALRAKSVLEVFLYGGLSPWETFYFVEEYGRPGAAEHPDTQLYAFGGDDQDSLNAALASCGLDQAPLGQYFADDARGAPVQLGPFVQRLRARPDLLARLRLLVQKHELEPHEAAVPLALTGKPVGSPSMAGLGAHIQRYFHDREAGQRRSPYSYVFSTGGLPGDNVQAALSTGQHPGSARPLRIKVDAADRLMELLGRPTVGNLDERQRFDALLGLYGNAYESRLRHGGSGDPLRSPRVRELLVAQQSLADVDGFREVLEPSLFISAPGERCGNQVDFDVPAMSFRLAAHLLTHPIEPARYVCLVDTGLLEASGGGGYDTHTDHAHDTARNLDHMFAQLTGIINVPGESDPGKLDLDDTLIILNTEFGRTPWRQDDRSSGRNHHPSAYTTALLGGPVRAEQRGIVGAIDASGQAAGHVTPSENRIAALLSLGIYPFSPESFGVSDVKDAGNEAEAVASVTERVLGVSV